MQFLKYLKIILPVLYESIACAWSSGKCDIVPIITNYTWTVSRCADLCTGIIGAKYNI